VLASGIVGKQSVQQWGQWGPMRGLPVMKRTLSVYTEVQLRFWRAKEEREKRARETSRREVDGRAGHNQHTYRQEVSLGRVQLHNWSHGVGARPNLLIRRAGVRPSSRCA
jgi:hypothetical protein